MKTEQLRIVPVISFVSQSMLETSFLPAVHFVIRKNSLTGLKINAGFLKGGTMKKIYFVSILFCTLLAVAQEMNLIRNPKFEKGLAEWDNWGKDRLQIAISDGKAILKSERPGLNQGIAQSIELKPGCKYEYSVRFTAEFFEDAYANLLSWHCLQTKRGGNLRSVRTNTEWDTHTLIFTTPHDLQEKVLLRPLIIFGSAQVTISEVTIRELCNVVKVEAPEKPELPVIVPVVHPKMTIDLSNEKPVNIRAHINEKNDLLPDGGSVSNENNTFIINYSFTTSGHDAVMFDIVREIPSCAKVSMEITSNGNGHRLFFVLVDKNDESHYVIKPLNLDFKQRNVTMSLRLDKEEPYSIFDSKWGGDGNQHLDMPLKKITVGVDDMPDKTIEKGTVTIKNLQIGNW